MRGEGRALPYVGNFKIKQLGSILRKPVNANSGLKVNRGIHFSFIKVFFTAYALCSLRLFKLKSEEQTI